MTKFALNWSKNRLRGVIKGSNKNTVVHKVRMKKVIEMIPKLSFCVDNVENP